MGVNNNAPIEAYALHPHTGRLRQRVRATSTTHSLFAPSDRPTDRRAGDDGTLIKAVSCNFASLRYLPLTRTRRKLLTRGFATPQTSPAPVRAPKPSAKRPWSLRDRLDERDTADLITAYREGLRQRRPRHIRSRSCPARAQRLLS
jgi:hypothetical protein